MANYETLKAAIQSVIKTNGNNEITGSILQSSLLSMISSLGANFQFAGIANSSTDPGTPDQNVFYIASTAGTYTNFNGLVVNEGEVAILKWNGSWTKNVSGAVSEERVQNISQEIYALTQATTGLHTQFEGGGINYLTGVDIDDPKSIKTPLIGIFGDVNIEINLGKTITRFFIIKYLNGAYVSYSQITMNGTQRTVSLEAEDTFDAIRLRCSANTDFNSTEIANSTYSINADGNLNERISASEGLEENHSFFGRQYADLSDISVGSHWNIVCKNADAYGFNIVKCGAGDRFLLKTADNTAGAKAYAFFNIDWECLSFQQEDFLGKLVAPDNAAYLVVNSRLTGGVDFHFIQLLGRVVTQASLRKKSFSYYNALFERGSIYYNTGVLTDGVPANIRTEYIPVESDVYIYVKSILQFANINIYLIKYLNGEYVDYETIFPGTGSFAVGYYLKKDDTFNGFRLRFTATSNWDASTIQENICYVVPLDNVLMRDFLIGDTRKQYGIGNYDNDFQFDNLFVGQLVATLIQMQPNFEMPTEGAFVSTDVDYTGMRTNPQTDEQILKANIPYLYVNGEKRGTIVLYDTDGTPFIYDKNGNKRTLTLA